jgi:hypothetical protein
MSSLMFVSKARNYPRMKHLKGSPLGLALAFPTVNKIGWKDLPRTKTLAQYEQSKITTVKSFITF